MADLPIPSQRGPVPPGFDEWFARTTARDKLRRYQSIKQAADALSAICIEDGTAPELANLPRSATMTGSRAIPRKFVGVLGKTPAPSALTIPVLSNRRYGLLAVTGVTCAVLATVIVRWGWQHFYGSAATNAALLSTSTPTPTALTSANLAVAAPNPIGSMSPLVDAEPKPTESNPGLVASAALPAASAPQTNQPVTAPRTSAARRSAPQPSARPRANAPRPRPVIDDDNVAAF